MHYPFIGIILIFINVNQPFNTVFVEIAIVAVDLRFNSRAGQIRPRRQRLATAATFRVTKALSCGDEPRLSLRASSKIPRV